MWNAMEGELEIKFKGVENGGVHYEGCLIPGLASTTIQVLDIGSAIFFPSTLFISSFSACSQLVLSLFSACSQLVLSLFSACSQLVLSSFSARSSARSSARFLHSIFASSGKDLSLCRCLGVGSHPRGLVCCHCRLKSS
jgi:hypothetical protein